MDAMRHQFLEFLATYQSSTRYMYMESSLVKSLCHQILCFRQLASKQLAWFKREKDFYWLNIAPGGGERLPMDMVAEKVKEWFLSGVPLPSEWDGSSLKNLVCVLSFLQFFSLFYLRHRWKKISFTIIVQIELFITLMRILIKQFQN